MSVSPDAPKAPHKRRRSTKKSTAASDAGQGEEGEGALVYTFLSSYLLIFRIIIGTTHSTGPRDLRKSTEISSLFTLNSGGTVLRGKIAMSPREFALNAHSVVFRASGRNRKLAQYQTDKSQMGRVQSSDVRVSINSSGQAPQSSNTTT